GRVAAVRPQHQRVALQHVHAHPVERLLALVEPCYSPLHDLRIHPASVSRDELSEGVLLAPAMVTPTGRAPVRGRALSDVSTVADAALAWRDGRLTYAGPAADLPAEFGALPRTEVTGAVIP